MASPDPLISLNAGPVQLKFDPRIGSLRYFTVAGKEVLRGIYAVVRDQFWATIPQSVTVTKQDIRKDSFDIELTASCQRDDISYACTGKLWGTADGEIGFDFSGVSHSDFQRNRIGICVLHPIEASADGAFRVLKPDGAWVDHQFPAVDSIAPKQPATDICAMDLSAVGGGRLRIEFEHEHFEMEDQRNWGDHSFKTYCTPQHRPRPVAVAKGDTVRQVAKVRFFESPAGSGKAPRKRGLGAMIAGVFKKRDEPQKLEEFPIVPRPKLGLVAIPDEALATPEITSALKEMRLDHLRIDLRLRDPHWRQALERASEAAKAAETRLHLALFLTDDWEAELAEVHSTIAHDPVALILVFHERKGRTPDDLPAKAREIFDRAIDIAAGSDSSFNEVNGSRPSADADWFLCYPSQPQSHLFDDETLGENFPAQFDTLRSAAKFTAKPVVLSPITVSKRFQNDAWFKGVIKEWTPLPPDARQDGDFGAAWLVASISWIARANNLHSATYFCTHGPGGVLDADGSPRLSGQVLTRISKSDTVTPVSTFETRNHSVIILSDRTVVMANHSNSPHNLGGDGGEVVPPWSVVLF